MLGSYLALLRSRSFRGYMFGGAFTSTSFYAYLTASPFIFTQILHRPATEVGRYCLAVMSGVPIGSFAASRWASRVRLNLLLCDERHRRAGRRAVLCCGGERQAQPRDRALADDPRFDRRWRLRPGGDHLDH